LVQHLWNEGKFWEGHKLCRSATEEAEYVVHFRLGRDSISVLAVSELLLDGFLTFYKFEVERLKRIKETGVDGELPRDYSSVEEAECLAREHPGAIKNPLVGFQVAVIKKPG
jgi:hypothetical protein